MFFILKSTVWLFIGFLIVRPALFDDAVSDPGALATRGVMHAAQVAEAGLEHVQNSAVIGGETIKFCLDRKELCKQTTGAIGELIVGSIPSMQQKEHIKRNGFSLKKSANNKEPFVPKPRLRPGKI